MPDTFRALVVDDEPAIRELVVRSLRQQGLNCEAAADGRRALEAVQRAPVDVVITDLRMPERNGHSLAVELLGLHNRPLVVVLTGILEPRLVRDLLLRGVDDVMFKPVDHMLFASKVVALLERRRVQHDRTKNLAASSLSGKLDEGDGPVTVAALEEKLGEFGSILPLSDVALEVVGLTNSIDYDVRKVTRTLERDPALVAEVFRTVNSPCFNSSGRQIKNLEEAIVRLGQKRTGELALAAKALDALTANILPWMDVRLCWRASLASGAAVKQLLPASGIQASEGLYLGALLHSVGRIVLGTLYPRRYQRMVAACHARQAALIDLERQEFPESHAEVLARLLERWKLPAEVVEPLRHVCRPYAVLAELYQPLRSKVEMLKLAILFGRLAAGRFEPWELVELPPPALLNRWKAEELSRVIGQAQGEMEQRSEPDWGGAASLTPASPASGKELRYRNCAGARFDFVEPILEAMGFEVAPYHGLASDDEPLLVNCFGASGVTLPRQEDERLATRLILMARHERSRYEGCGQPLELPLSYQALRSACEATTAASSAAALAASLQA